jgi:hypothetical protein
MWHCVYIHTNVLFMTLKLEEYCLVGCDAVQFCRNLSTFVND